VGREVFRASRKTKDLQRKTTLPKSVVFLFWKTSTVFGSPMIIFVADYQ
jgi:hypothetical protein